MLTTFWSYIFEALYSFEVFFAEPKATRNSVERNNHSSLLTLLTHEFQLILVQEKQENKRKVPHIVIFIAVITYRAAWYGGKGAEQGVCLIDNNNID